MASHYIRWSKAEDDFLLENYYEIGAKGVALRLGRSDRSCAVRFNKLYKERKKKNVRK